jgi:DNA-binding winged helix-turn-helix (wHTH) protein/tetratricopeptide (TPR) repeat protein
MSLETKEIFEFGEFRLDADEHTIERIDGAANGSLPEKAFRALLLLIRRRGHLVSRNELIRHIWPDTIVEDNNLEKCIHQIRHFLGETSEGKPYIETVRKHGYRFVGPVNVVEVSETWLPETFRLPDEGRHGHPFGSSGSGEVMGTVKRPSSPRRHLAESENVTAEPSSPRNFRIRSAYLAIGIVLLISASIYAYFRVTSNARINSSPEPGTTSEEALGLYRQAENLSARRLREDMPAAMDDLNRAVIIDPNFARAWAAKSHLHRYFAEYPGADQTEQYQSSMEALGKALAIDPNSSEAHSALCLNKLRYEYDSAGAESVCIRAVELDPHSFVSHKAYATFLFSKGRFDEANAEIKQALDIQPLALENLQTYALVLHYSRRYEEEETQWLQLMQLNPPHGYIYTRLFMNLKQQGKEDKAFDFLIKKLVLEHVGNDVIDRFRTAFAQTGWRGVTIERIKHPEIESFTGPFDIACLYATLGDRDKAFEYLEKGYLEHDYRIAVLQVEPQLDGLRDDPRYADLVRRVESND